MKSDDRNPQDYDAERQNLGTCLKNADLEDAGGFEPPLGGLVMPRRFLTRTSICRALAVLFLLHVSGALDAQSTLALGQIFLP